MSPNEFSYIYNRANQSIVCLTKQNAEKWRRPKILFVYYNLRLISENISQRVRFWNYFFFHNALSLSRFQFSRAGYVVRMEKIYTRELTLWWIVLSGIFMSSWLSFGFCRKRSIICDFFIWLCWSFRKKYVMSVVVISIVYKLL